MEEPGMEQPVLKFYIAGRIATDQRAISSLEEICRKDFFNEQDRYELAVMNVQKRPPLAGTRSFRRDRPR